MPTTSKLIAHYKLVYKMGYGHKHFGATKVSIEIYNIKGQSVARLNTILPSGTMICNFDLPQIVNGVYLCRVRAGQQSATAKLSIVN